MLLRWNEEEWRAEDSRLIHRRETQGQCGGSVTFLVESKRTEASPSSTMEKIVEEEDSKAFGPEGLSNWYLSERCFGGVRTANVGVY